MDQITDLEATAEEYNRREAILLNLLNQASGFYEDTIGVLSGIFKLSEYVRKGSPEDDFYTYLVNVLLEESRCENASVFVISNNRLELKAASGAHSGRSNKSLSLELGEGVAGRCAAQGEFILVSDTSSCDFFEDRSDTCVRIGSMLCVPIKEADQTVGVLNLSHSQADFFNVHDVRMFELLGLLVGQMMTIIGIYEVFKKEYVGLEQSLEEKDSHLKTITASYKSVVDASDEMILIAEGQHIKFYNQAFHETVGKPPRNLGDVFCDAANSVITKHMELLAKDESCEFDCNLSIGSKKNITGQFYIKNILENEFLIILRDITIKKRMEQRNMQTEKLASLGMLTSGIAHELNNKLTPIIGFADLIDKSRLSEKDNDRFEVIISAADSAKNIIESLLTFSRNVPPERSSFDLREVVDRAISLYGPTIRKRAINIDHSRAAHPLMVQADMNCMEQVIVNLINNAIDAIGDAGDITITSFSEGDFAALSVQDSGPGIPDELIPKVFDPFFTTKSVDKGTGLGLSICYGIISDHMGDISIENSSPGARITLKIPAIICGAPAHQPQPPAPEKTQPHHQDHNALIMIVEDEKDLRELMLDALEPHYKVLCYTNGREALDNVASENWQLIISDLRMPEIDGMEFFREATRLDPSLKDRFLFTTGDTYDLQVKKFLEETQSQFIRKPFRIKELLSIIEQRIETGKQGGSQ